MAVEDRVVWGTADALRGVVDAVKRPFQRIAWGVENTLVWPIREEAAVWSRPTRAAALAALVALAGAAVAAGIVISNPSGEADRVSTLAGPAAPALTGSARQTAPTGPALHGTAPNFTPEAGEGVPRSAESEVLRSEAGTQGAAAGTAEAGSAAGGQGNAPALAGPAAIKVAHRFAEAFVLYEIGRSTPQVKAAIAATTSPDLTKALLGRPPRLPSNVKVPKARVLNIVPGPSSGGTYTLSASLLRAGVTSELRMDMKRAEDGAWQVTDVTG
jgi:hypothetical protein